VETPAGRKPLTEECGPLPGTTSLEYDPLPRTEAEEAVLPSFGRCSYGLAALLLLTGLPTGCSRRDAEVERVDPTAAVMEDFSRRVDAYMKVRDSLAAALGPWDETKSQSEIAARTTSLATTIGNARAQARQGDLFTPEAAAIFATLIKEEYRRRGDSVQESREDQVQEHEIDGLPGFVPKVNEQYPTTYPLATFPPTLLPILPKLPEKLEYRAHQHYLILRDIEANLIVDFMPNAIP
jgi:hypothetical protein